VSSRGTGYILGASASRTRQSKHESPAYRVRRTPPRARHRGTVVREETPSVRDTSHPVQRNLAGLVLKRGDDCQAGSGEAQPGPTSSAPPSCMPKPRSIHLARHDRQCETRKRTRRERGKQAAAPNGEHPAPSAPLCIPRRPPGPPVARQLRFVLLAPSLSGFFGLPPALPRVELAGQYAPADHILMGGFLHQFANLATASRRATGSATVM